MAQYVANMIEIIERYVNEHQQQNHHHHNNNKKSVVVLVDDDMNGIIRSFLDKASSFRDFLIHSNFFLRLDIENNDVEVDELLIRTVNAATYEG